MTAGAAARARLRLWGLAMVRNEADIIEPFVRHNLTVLDGLAVIDHGSIDGTLEMLAALAREGLPVHVLRNDIPGYHQSAIMTAGVRATLAGEDADFVFPLDADEFLRVPSRDALERALRAIPAGMHGVMQWHTYVPDFAGRPPDFATLARGARRLARERHGLHKAVVGRHFVEAVDTMLAMGSHFVQAAGALPNSPIAPHARIAPEVAALAHLPVRSPGQFATKVLVKRLVQHAANNRWAAEKYDVYRLLKSGAPVSRDILAHYAVNWSVKPDRWIDPKSAELVDAPFLADVPQRLRWSYDVDPMPLVLSAAERLVRTAAATAKAGAA